MATIYALVDSREPDAFRYIGSDALKGVNAGERSGRSTLTAEQVEAMYLLKVRGGVSHVDIGAQFGVHPMHIYKIVSGKAWAHLNLKERFG